MSARIPQNSGHFILVHTFFVIQNGHPSQDFSVVVALHWNGCVRCHSSTDQNVIDTIDAGDGIYYDDTGGMDVSCENCHTQGHHDSTYAQAGICTQCHKTPAGMGNTVTATVYGQITVAQAANAGVGTDYVDTVDVTFNF